jgi:hypothetical protein
MNEQPVVAPTDRQAAYLRHLASRAHSAGMPHLPIDSFTRAQAAEWIDYLHLVLDAEERVRETLERARREAAEDTSRHTSSRRNASSCRRRTGRPTTSYRRPTITSTSWEA